MLPARFHVTIGGRPLRAGESEPKQNCGHNLML